MATERRPLHNGPYAVHRQRFTPLSWRRRLSGWVLAAAGPSALTFGFVGAGTDVDVTTLNFLCHLTVVVFVALLGGWWPAVATALLSTMLLNWFFTPPTGQWIIHEPLNVVALCLFLIVAAGVALLVDIEARRTAEARRAQHQAGVLFELSGDVISEGLRVPALLDRLRRTYNLEGVALAANGTGRPDTESWEIIARSGSRVSPPGACDRTVVVDEHHRLLVEGSPADPGDQGILEAFAARIAAVLQQQELAETHLRARELAAGNAMRTALLAAVSHDLRTPLSGIKASVSSLRMDDVKFSEHDIRELLSTIEDSADQLAERIENLLDMSRIQAGELVVHRERLELDDLVAAAAHSLSDSSGTHRIRIDVPADSPAVLGDYGLLVRVIANLLENALKHSRTGPVVVQALSETGGLRIVDRGPGVSDADKEQIFRPFQRLGDRGADTGVGLGLAIARGLAEGMGGRIRAEDTPGGGLTMVLTLPTPETTEPVEGRTP